MTNKKTVSIGIICFNEELNVPLAYQELAKLADSEKKYNFEFIFVDNGSTDATKKEIKKVAKDKRVSGIFLSRNFGPESSSQASLDYATGDAFVLYECDMQDPPEIISTFIREWEKGFKVVVGTRNKIEDTLVMTFIRKAYYRILRAISNIDVPVDTGSFALLDKNVMDAMRKLPEKYRFYRGLRAWVGFKTTFIIYQRRKRQYGKTSYNIFRYIHHSERSFFGFSYLPLDIIVYLGLIIVIFSFICIIVYLFLFYLFGQTIRESMLIIFSIVLFGGIQLLALSVIGKYIQVIVEETKARPVYLVEEIVSRRNLNNTLLPDRH
ncbi:MAG: hypothetical protein ACD_32C00113G0022 [uncultured bacterium]|uniref:Glycosyltransferase 2-like domain-containing protein n=1 Tax=Candidatus Daviesbacteria bacterium GW2011_GWC2_40_12 TaxID=1618431 RepID=A0A0G0T6B8_9BACT|nr:MAG: hypothetical protein ACD_32C00113G0022 [uncultured bacterium]KKR17261.1 MAG: hypothetical protein UT45_C0002G0090 [Candidatus Daviesbacteria bacterium GW2011_GWA2_39_33]KKR42660.1 MAG: hypothetical protein UT77_C0001G0111 [Candidatus Daviesbacteria bacterium GW2011_GWC2_40_12]OGE21335.1 MAG: hypothetical protein A2778_04165 [Candidatus Daviesbacteria bacterium RIFCSPHIGHO2_01_FULL_40_24]OGE30147.1 MAG: hypothetical protein A3C29_01955 [Candidatus Daviesbacteria bacterium RIFCSPHIGHO2_02